MAISQEWSGIDNYDIEWVNLNHTSPHGSIYTDIITDSLGYRWICSNGGLHVFDGAQTITYFGKDRKYQLLSDSISGDFISMVIDNDGKLWLNLRYSNKLVKFDPIKRVVEDVISSPNKNHINSNILRINDQNELIYMVFDYDDETYKLYNYDGQGETTLLYQHDYIQNNNKNRIYRFYSFRDKYFLLSSDKIIMLDSNGNVEHNWPLMTDDKIISDLLYSDGKIIAISNDSRLLEAIHIPTKTWTVIHDTSNMSKGIHHSYLTIIDDVRIGGNFKHLFIGTLKNKHILDLSEEFVKRRSMDTPSSLTTEIVQVSKASNQSYFILTTDQLYILKKKKPSLDQFLIPMPEPDSNPSMRQLTKLKDGSIAASYYGGLAIQKNEVSLFQPYKFKNATSHKIKGLFKEAYSLSTWNDKLIWNNAVINGQGELSTLDDRVEMKHTTSVILNDTLYSHTWYDSESRILRYDLKSKKKEFIKISSKNDTSWTNFMLSNKMIADTISNQIWIATSKKGLFCVDTELNVLRHYSPTQLKCLKNKYVYDLEIRDDILWYTSNDGLGSLNLKTDEVQMYHLPYVNEYQILDDKILWSLMSRDNSSFYIGTDIGLYYFDIKSKTFFGLEDDHPMSQLEYNRHSTLRDGEVLYFGTTSGLYKCKESDLQWKYTSRNIGPIIVQSVTLNKGTPRQKLFNQDVTSIDQMALSPEDNTVDINFSIINEYNNIYYNYRILEVDTNWTSHTIDNSINIFSLPVGYNTLEIKASYQMDDRYSVIKKIVLHRSQYWYKRWWAYLLYASLFSTAMWLIYRNRINQIMKYQNLRTRISSDLHDDVGSIMSGISLQAEMMSYSSKDEDKPLLSELSSMSKDAMEKMRDIVWALDSRKDNIEDLTLKMQEYANICFSKKNMQFKFEKDTSKGMKSLNPEHRQNVYLIFKEALNNIIKHSNASHVHIQFVNNSNGLELKISDNGTQHSTLPSSGQGISNMKMRAQRIGGEIKLDQSSDHFSVYLRV